MKYRLNNEADFDLTQVELAVGQKLFCSRVESDH